MWSTALGLSLCCLLAILVLPLPRVRQAVLAFAARAGQSAALAAVATCGTFFAQPQAVPTWVGSHSDPLLNAVRDCLPDSLSVLPGLPWLLMAIAIVIISLPVLSLIEFSARVMGQTAMVQALRKELRAAAAALDRKLAGMTEPTFPATTGEVAAAADAMREVAGEARRPRPTPSRLVRDLL